MNISRNVEKKISEKNFDHVMALFSMFFSENSGKILLHRPPLLLLSSFCSWDLCAHFGTKFSSGSIWDHVISTLWKCLVRQKIGKLFEKFPDKKQNFLETISSGLQGYFLVISSYPRPFEVTLGQNKFRITGKIKIFKKNFWPLGVGNIWYIEAKIIRTYRTLHKKVPGWPKWVFHHKNLICWEFREKMARSQRCKNAVD